MAQMGSVAKMICVLDGDTVPCARTCMKATKIRSTAQQQARVSIMRDPGQPKHTLLAAACGTGASQPN